MIDRTVMTVALMLMPVCGIGAAQEKPKPPQRVTVHVKGIACPFCAFNLEKRIRTLDAVPKQSDFVTDLDAGTASFDWKADLPVDQEAIRDQIRRAGFTAGQIVVQTAKEPLKKDSEPRMHTWTGTVSTQGDSLRFTIDDSKETIVLRSANREDRKTSFRWLTAYVKQETDDTEAEDPKPVRVRVVVKEPKTGDPGSAWELRRWEPVEYGAHVLLNVDALACEQCSLRSMRGLRELEVVLHAEADHETDRIDVWTLSEQPDLQQIRQTVEEMGFEVTHAHVFTQKEDKKDEPQSDRDTDGKHDAFTRTNEVMRGITDLPAPTPWGNSGLNTDVALTPPEGGTVVRTQWRYTVFDDDTTPPNSDVAVSAFPITAVHGLKENFSLLTTVPLVHRRAEIGPLDETDEQFGVADIPLLAKYRFYQHDETGRTTRWAAIGGVEIPTFDEPFSSESADPIVGTVWTHQRLDWWVDWDVLYKFNTAGGVAGDDELRADIAYSHRIFGEQSDRIGPWGVFGIAEVNSRYLTDGSSEVFASPGVQLITPRLILEAGVQLPVHQDMASDRLERDFTTVFSMRFQF